MMLADHRRSVTDVALSCGFGGTSYFASTFRKLTGRTPTDYRRSLF
jgi:AraC-like DNA-binding protein